MLLTDSTMLQTIMDNSEQLITFGTDLLQKVIEHPILGLFFAAGFIGTGIYVVKRLIGLARR